jgi:hypothetical protein
MKEVEYNNEKSAREGKVNELIKLNEDIKIVINFLKEYIFNIINVLKALI